MPTTETKERVPSLLSQETVATNRQEILRTLAMNAPDIAKTADALRPKEIYRVVLSSPAKGQLNARADGLFDAFVKDDKGKIVSVARLGKIGPQFINAAGFLSGQAMMAQVSAQLSSIQRDVDLTIDLKIREIAAKLDAARKSLFGLDHFREDLKEHAVLQAHEKLNDVVAQSIHHLDGFLSAIPDPPSSNFTRMVPGIDNRKDVEKALDRAEAMMTILLSSLFSLSEAHLILHGRQKAAKFMLGWLEKARSLDGLVDAELKARQLPITKQEERRELFWVRAMSELDMAINVTRRECDEDEPMQLTWQCSAEELLAGFAVREAAQPVQ